MKCWCSTHVCRYCEVFLSRVCALNNIYSLESLLNARNFCSYEKFSQTFSKLIIIDCEINNLSLSSGPIRLASLEAVQVVDSQPAFGHDSL